MNSLGLPQGFEVFHEVKDMDDLDDISLGSAGDMSLVTMTELDGDGKEDDDDDDDDDENDNINIKEEDDDNKGGDNNDDAGDGKQEAAAPAEDDRKGHMVSHDSMATVRVANVPGFKKWEAKSKQTPYDSLKSLVENKRKSRDGGNSFPSSTSSGGMVSRPSTFLREALYGCNVRSAPQANQEFDAPAAKKTKIEDREVQNHVLHKACIKRGAEAEVIAAILKIDKNLACIAHQIFQVKQVYDCASYKSRTSKVKEKYCYPLNIAIRNQIQYAAIELLVKAAPQVAAMSDGSMKECSLSILLKHSPLDSQLADLLLLSNPTCATLIDKHENTPLHVACQFGAALSIVKHICILHPEALKMRNHFGHTPIEVAQRSIRGRHLAAYLYTKQRGIF
mmetsp:Transcript_10868/g.14401  ORF Transcript_10868/g.14401 Transcript_10868/m.14401 type:complete len:393 (+) Transcript_10868:237-1415(+)|eukprot:CAMPEP_0198138170 /NCGR_PEP_ID=MMETSP1443-20131203/1591_1 /TAXON_ID=186043 /ORGANISM="Entomoneis sp., Strain CCMP2396" /LENGTH=392 /DNA_ID=CAMNT_0043799833 /DNA_START=159 /DNA_END=1337 /DNA_ORIENTATION=-